MIDATRTDAANTILMHVDMAITRIRCDNQQLAHVLTHHVSLNERPKNAADRRYAAIAIFVYKHLLADNPVLDMVEDLSKMQGLGRTDRWKSAVRTWATVITGEADKNWAITQYAVFTNYAVD
jgi:hypothetical protein